ncbi:MAG: class I SAM-dependent methyltransferase [Stellaceae bacterium]
MLREASLPRTLPRTPEPNATMDSAESIAGFDEQGASTLLPIYHFNALAIGGLAPRGAHLVDLGCGTGRFLAYLAARRPDLRITGLDFAPDMVRIGQQHIARAGLTDRVRLMHGDMRAFRALAPDRADLISSIFSLHHLATRDDLLACLREIAIAIDVDHALLWIFDHARPRRQRTADEVPDIFTPDASPAFREDSRNSLSASWSFAELGAALSETLPRGFHAARSRLLPLYQIHWVEPQALADRGRWVEDRDLRPALRREARLLRLLFRRTPRNPAGDWRGWRSETTVS